jgi:hypothetical protein
MREGIEVTTTDSLVFKERTSAPSGRPTGACLAGDQAPQESKR